MRYLILDFGRGDPVSLQVKNLRIYYQTLNGDVKAVDGVTFKIERRYGDDREIIGNDEVGRE